MGWINMLHEEYWKGEKWSRKFNHLSSLANCQIKLISWKCQHFWCWLVCQKNQSILDFSCTSVTPKRFHRQEKNFANHWQILFYTQWILSDWLLDVSLAFEGRNVFKNSFPFSELMSVFHKWDYLMHNYPVKSCEIFINFQHSQSFWFRSKVPPFYEF